MITYEILNCQRINPEFNIDKKKISPSLHTIVLASLHLLFSLLVFIAGVYLELQWFIEHSCRTYYIMIYIRCIYWVVSIVIDILFRRRHNKLRRHGYHTLFKKILIYKNAPLLIVTIWNMVLFLIQTLMIDSYGAEFSMYCQRTSLLQRPITYVCTLCGLETVLLIFLHGSYIIRVYNFNSTQILPDALRDIEQPSIGSLGITVDNAKIGDLLEKQADLIYYLKEQNVNLKRKLLHFNQLSLYGTYQKI